MDIYKNYSVTYKGGHIGEALVRKKGDLTVISARCRKIGGGVLRLYAGKSGGEAIVLGIAVPSQDGLYFQKSYSESDMKAMGLYDLTGFFLHGGDEKSSKSGWQRAGDLSKYICDEDILRGIKNGRGVLYKVSGEEIHIAAPLLKSEPFCLMCAFSFGKYEKIGNGNYLVFCFKNGKLLI